MTKSWVARFFGLPHLEFLRHSTFVLRHSIRIRTTKVFPGELRGRLSRKEVGLRLYGVGDVTAGDSAVVAGDSVVVAGLVASVVVGGLVAAGLAAGSVVSVFCSHPARSAAPARIQMYFFIVLIGRGILL
jgi:hypothetical protein